MWVPFPESTTLTKREQRGIIYVGLLIWGTLAKSKGRILPGVAQSVGIGGLAHELWGWHQDTKLFANPDTMNGFWKTSGAFSGVRSEMQAMQVRKAGAVVK